MAVLPEVAGRDIAVVVTTFRRPEKLKRVLACLRAQTAEPRLKVFVVDAARELSPQELAWNAVTLISGRPDEWWGPTTDRGVRAGLEAGCRWFLLLNDDAVLPETFCEAMTTVAEEERCDILGPQINQLQRPERVWAFGSYSVWGTPEILRLHDHDATGADLAARMGDRTERSVMATCGAGLLVSRRVIEAVGLPGSTGVRAVHGDSAFCLAAAEKGVRTHVTRRAVLFNDLDNLGDQGSVDDFPKYPSLIAGLREHFFHPRSAAYLPTIWRISRRFAPKGTGVSTVVRFACVELWRLLRAFARPPSHEAGVAVSEPSGRLARFVRRLVYGAPRSSVDSAS